MASLTAYAPALKLVEQCNVINKVAWNTATENETYLFERLVRDDQAFRSAVLRWKLFYEKCCWGDNASAAGRRLEIAMRRILDTNTPEPPLAHVLTPLDREGPLPAILTNRQKQQAIINPDALQSRYGEPFRDYLQNKMELEQVPGAAACASVGGRGPTQTCHR